jgi:hypothetical protein
MRDSSRYQGIYAGFIYLLCLVVFFHPFLSRLGTSLLGPPGDNMQDFWNTWYSQKIIDSDATEFFFTDSINYPEGSSLIYHSFSYSNLILISMVRLVLRLPLNITVLVILHNLMLILSFILSALGAFYLAKYFTQSFFAALIAGFIFSFSPFHIAHSLQHVHVATIQYIPFFVLLFLIYMTKQTVPAFVGTVVFFVLSGLSSLYYLFYNMFFMVFYYCYAAALTRKLFVKDHLLRIGSLGCCGLLILAPLLVAMVVEGAGNDRAYARGHNTYVADLVGFFLFHPNHLLAQFVEAMNAGLVGNATERTVYLGLINLALLLGLLISGRGFNRHYFFCLGGMAFFMLFALGSYMHVAGNTLGIPLPTAVMEHIPFLRNIRTPSRAVVYVYLFLSVATAIAVKHLLSDQNYLLNGSRSRRQIVVILLSSLIVLDFYPRTLDLTTVECPGAYESIRGDDSPEFGVVDLPSSYVNGNRYMMYQICHEKPIVIATTSRKLTPSLSDGLEIQPSEIQKQQLARNSVKYIVMHRTLIPAGKKLDLDGYRQHYRTIYHDHRNTVFQVY